MHLDANLPYNLLMVVFFFSTPESVMSSTSSCQVSEMIHH
jgi:hypothetical protein